MQWIAKENSPARPTTPAPQASFANDAKSAEPRAPRLDQVFQDWSSAIRAPRSSAGVRAPM